MEPSTVGDPNGAAPSLGENNDIGHKFPEPPKWYRFYIEDDGLKIEPYCEEEERIASPGGFMGGSESADDSAAAEEDLSIMDGNTSEKRHQDATKQNRGSTELSQKDITRMNQQDIFSAEQVAAMGGIDGAVAKHRIFEFYKRQQEELKALGYSNDPSTNETLMEPGKFFLTIEANAMVSNGASLAEILQKNHVPTPLGSLGTKPRLRLSMKKFHGEVYTSSVTTRSGRGMKGMENDHQLMRRSVHLVNKDTDLGKLNSPGLHKPLVLQRGHVYDDFILKVDMKPVETTAWVRASNARLDHQGLRAVIRIHEEVNDISQLATSANNDLYSSSVRDKKIEINKWWFRKHADANVTHRDQLPENLGDAISSQRDRSREIHRVGFSNGRRSRSFSPPRARPVSPHHGDRHHQREPLRTDCNQDDQNGRYESPTYHGQAYMLSYENQHDRQRDISEHKPQITQGHRAPYHQRSPSPVANAMGHGATRESDSRSSNIGQDEPTYAAAASLARPGNSPHPLRTKNDQTTIWTTRNTDKSDTSTVAPQVERGGSHPQNDVPGLPKKRANSTGIDSGQEPEKKKKRTTTTQPRLQTKTADYEEGNDLEDGDFVANRPSENGPEDSPTRSKVGVMTNLGLELGDAKL